MDFTNALSKARQSVRNRCTELLEPTDHALARVGVLWLQSHCAEARRIEIEQAVIETEMLECMAGMQALNAAGALDVPEDFGAEQPVHKLLHALSRTPSQ